MAEINWSSENPERSDSEHGQEAMNTWRDEELISLSDEDLLRDPERTIETYLEKFFHQASELPESVPQVVLDSFQRLYQGELDQPDAYAQLWWSSLRSGLYSLVRQPNNEHLTDLKDFFLNLSQVSSEGRNGPELSPEVQKELDDNVSDGFGNFQFGFKFDANQEPVFRLLIEQGLDPGDSPQTIRDYLGITLRCAGQFGSYRNQFEELLSRRALSQWSSGNFFSHYRTGFPDNDNLSLDTTSDWLQRVRTIERDHQLPPGMLVAAKVIQLRGSIAGWEAEIVEDPMRKDLFSEAIEEEERTLKFLSELGLDTQEAFTKRLIDEGYQALMGLSKGKSWGIPGTFRDLLIFHFKPLANYGDRDRGFSEIKSGIDRHGIPPRFSDGIAIRLLEQRMQSALDVIAGLRRKASRKTSS